MTVQLLANICWEDVYWSGCLSSIHGAFSITVLFPKNGKNKKGTARSILCIYKGWFLLNVLSPSISKYNVYMDRLSTSTLGTRAQTDKENKSFDIYST